MPSWLIGRLRRGPASPFAPGQTLVLGRFERFAAGTGLGTLPPMAAGLFVVSIDLEMSWGAVHHGRPHDDAPYRRERQIVADVLSLMDRYGISATWATVGHLFLDGCEAVDGPPHRDLIRPSYPWLDGDWYDLDPASSLAADPTWYGSDLIEMIRSCPTNQEIGSHSFGHIIAGDPGCSQAAFEADVRAAISAAANLGIDLRSFVYPRNSIGHLGVLAEHGFTSYRGATPASGGSAPAHGFAPVLEGDLVNIPHTYLFDPGSRWARRLGTRGWSHLIRRPLRTAVKKQSMFHLWFHSHNLSGHRGRANRAMDRLFAHARAEIDAGRLRNLTMGEVAAEVLAADAET